MSSLSDPGSEWLARRHVRFGNIRSYLDGISRLLGGRLLSHRGGVERFDHNYVIGTLQGGSRFGTRRSPKASHHRRSSFLHGVPVRIGGSFHCRVNEHEQRRGRVLKSPTVQTLGWRSIFGTSFGTDGTEAHCCDDSRKQDCRMFGSRTLKRLCRPGGHFQDDYLLHRLQPGEGGFAGEGAFGHSFVRSGAHRNGPEGSSRRNLTRHRLTRF